MLSWNMPSLTARYALTYMYYPYFFLPFFLLFFILQSAVGLPAKKLDIFLMMVEPEDRAYPMPVVTLASAKVQELIGLICWQYTMEGRQPPLE
jgi:hypothetical protein